MERRLRPFVKGDFGGVGGVGPGEVQHGVMEGVSAHVKSHLVHRVLCDGSFDTKDGGVELGLNL